MTSLMIIGLILLFMIVPYLLGNVYGFAFRKKKMGVVATYLAGMAIMYAILTALQFLVVKFKFNFGEVTKIYSVAFIVCIVLGVIALMIRGIKQRAIYWDVKLSKKSVWILGMVFLQGILYIGLKNPYFEDNALLETARVTLETGTVYECNAFTGMKVQAGFPLSNKLMFLPMLYAYISAISGVDLALMFNFVMPVVTFISFYLVMLLWVQKLAKEHEQRWELWLFLLVWIVQVGDGFNHSTSFRILHSGYTGEAIFFGVLLTYALYEIKNKGYLIALGSIATFLGLVKYDLLMDFAKRCDEYWKEAALSGGILLIYILTVIYMMVKRKKIAVEMLNVNLIITSIAVVVWKEIVECEKNKLKRLGRGGLVLLAFLMCGNVMVVSNATSWRNNQYGIDKEEYEVIRVLDEQSEFGKQVAACDEVVKWLKRLDVKVEPVIGYDLGGVKTGWYSYEKYNETQIKLWTSINYAMASMEQDLNVLSDEIDMDYVVVRRVTENIPIEGNDLIKCVYDSPDYLVYSVDKK